MRSMKPLGARAFRDGFTLVELLVVILLIGIAFALVVPSFALPRPETEHAVQRVVDSARRLALRRAGEVVLTFDADGAWRIEEAGGLDPDPLGSGVLARPYGEALRLRISALGACSLDGADPVRPAIDLIRCRVIE